jgi:hypothetical protein
MTQNTNPSLLHKEGTAPRPIVRVSQIISALSYALDLTENWNTVR